MLSISKNFRVIGENKDKNLIIVYNLIKWL